MEAMVEGLVALCDCGPDHTGHVEDSLGIIQRLGLVVQHLDASVRSQAASGRSPTDHSATPPGAEVPTYLWTR